MPECWIIGCKQTPMFLQTIHPQHDDTDTEKFNLCRDHLNSKDEDGNLIYNNPNDRTKTEVLITQ